MKHVETKAYFSFVTFFLYQYFTVGITFKKLGLTHVTKNA